MKESSIKLGFEMSHPRSFVATDMWVESILLFPTLPTCLLEISKEVLLFTEKN